MGKSLHPITNWSQYNKSLISRGSLTFWVDAAAMNNWFHHDHHGRRGRSQLYLFTYDEFVPNTERCLDVFAAATGEHGHLAVVPDTLRREAEIHYEDS